MPLRAELLRVREGVLTWDAFFRVTAKDWRRLAEHLYDRWPSPAGVSAEDVEQELRVAAWQLMPQWKPELADVDRFIVWNAATAAKRWLHRQRNARRREDTSVGRFPVPLSSLGRGEEGERLPEPAVDAPQGLAFERIERLGRVLWQLDLPDQQCVLALVAANGDVEGAADSVYEDPRARLVCRLGCREDARRAVRRAAQAVEYQDVT